MAASNVSEVPLGVSAGGLQATLKEKIPPYSAEKKLVYPAIPQEATWGQVIRVSAPASITVRADTFPCWRRVLLRFDAGLRALAGDVTECCMSPMGHLMAIDSIACYFDNVKVHEIENGQAGVICQKYMDSVIRRSAADVCRGWASTPYLMELARQAVTIDANPVHFGSYDTLGGAGKAMLEDRAIDLSLLFDDLFTNFDPRCAGRGPLRACFTRHSSHNRWYPRVIVRVLGQRCWCH